MSVPRNLSPAYATVIPTLPYETHQDASEAPAGKGFASTCDLTQRNALWFVVRTTPHQTWLGVKADPTGAGDYEPVLSIWTGTPPGALTQYQVGAQAFCGALDGGFWQIPVTPDTTYYLQVTNGSPVTPLGTTLHLQVVGPPSAAVPAGSFLITDDETGFPAVALGASDGAFLQFFAQVPAGEFVDTMPTGEWCFADGEGNATGIGIFDATLTRIATHDFVDLIKGIKSDRNNLFYVLTQPSGIGGVITVHTISKAGVVGVTTWALPSNSAGALQFAVTRDGATLYYAKPSAGEAIHAYDLNGNTALADLHAGFTGESPAGAGDGFVAADGTIVFAFKGGASGTAGRVRIFNPDGTVAALYDLASAAFAIFNHLAFAGDSPAALAAWGFLSGQEDAAFQKVRLSDGVVLASPSGIQVSGGSGSTEDQPANPYSISNSCPLVIVPPPGLSAAPIDTFVMWTSAICGAVRFQRITLTGTGFPTHPVVTATDSEGHAVTGSIVASTPTEIVLLIALLSCTDWTFAIADADEILTTRTFLLQPTNCECCMSSKLDLINAALYKLGISKTIASLAEQSREAFTGVALVDDTIRHALRSFPWPFATRYADAADAASPGDPMELVGGTATVPVTKDWQYAYRQPLDCLFARRLVDPATRRAFSPSPMPYRVGRHWEASEDDDYLLVYTNQENAVLEYTADTSCLTDFSDPIFRDAVAWLLAARMGPSLGRQDKRPTECLQIYEHVIARAMAVSSQEHQPEPSGDAEWIHAR